MIKNLNKKKKSKGFTLIELIIVIAIIGILAAVAIPKFGAVRENAKVKTDIANAKIIANAATLLVDDATITLPTGTTALNVTSQLATHLQNVPVPTSKKALASSGTTAFVATVDKDGNVKVTANTVVFYPEYTGATTTP